MYTLARFIDTGIAFLCAGLLLGLRKQQGERF